MTAPDYSSIKSISNEGELASETINYNTKHCVKSVQIRSCGPYFSAF